MPPPASCTDQVTPVDWPDTVPVTIAENASEPPVVVAAIIGVTATAMSGTTVTVAASLLVGTARLVATTWKAPGVAGAV